MKDPVDRELLALRVYPSKAERSIAGVHLTEDQYFKYQQMSGQLMHNYLTSVISHPDWTTRPMGERVKVVRKVITRAREQSRAYIKMSAVGSDNDIAAIALQNKVSGMYAPESEPSDFE